MFGIFKKVRAAMQPIMDARAAQRELCVAFDANGQNFMNLHPIIHGALMKEAMVSGTEATFEKYVEIVTALDEQDGTDDQKANVLLEFYRAREKQFGEALT
jgi:hypothetical protein